MPAIHPQPASLRPINPLVKGFILSHRNRKTDYIADKVLPAFPVGNERTGEFSRTRKGAFHGGGPGQKSLVRSMGSDPVVAKGVQYDTVSYKIDPRDIVYPLDKWYTRTADVNLEVKQAHFAQLSDYLVIDRENRAAQMFFSANFTADNVVSWVNSGGTPVVDIDDTVRTVWENSGRRPNGAILPYTVAQWLRTHDDVIAAQSLTRDRSVFTLEDLAVWLKGRWGLDVHFGVAMEQTTAENIDPVTFGSIWDTQPDGNQMWIGHMSDAGGLGTRRDDKVWNSQGVAAVRPVADEEQFFEEDTGGWISHLHAHLAESIDLISTDFGRRLTFA